MRAPDVGIGDIQVVAGDGDVEVVFKRQSYRVVHRNVKLAIVHELVDARRISQVRRLYVARNVGTSRVGEVRPRFRVLFHIKWLRR